MVCYSCRTAFCYYLMELLSTQVCKNLIFSGKCSSGSVNRGSATKMVVMLELFAGVVSSDGSQVLVFHIIVDKAFIKRLIDRRFSYPSVRREVHHVSERLDIDASLYGKRD